jgi:lysophosphatidylcholine acyltransferase/lyso-PAF acetyltransferase
LISFKPGAFIPGLPVQPIVIKYDNKFDCVTWPSFGINLVMVFFYTLSQFHNNMEITVRPYLHATFTSSNDNSVRTKQFLPVMTPNEAEKRDPKLFANSVRRAMASSVLEVRSRLAIHSKIFV